MAQDPPRQQQIHQAGRVALVTGANSGVGLALTRRLLDEGADVIALIRSEMPAELGSALVSGRLRVYQADFTDFNQLHAALDQIKAHEPKIDVLFNNAGAAFRDLHFTPHGHEAHFETNAVIPYIILMELKPLLKRGSLKTVINTSSNAQLLVHNFDLDTLLHPKVFRLIVGPYGASKKALSLWTYALAHTLSAEGIEIRSVCPGLNDTKMTADSALPLPLAWIQALMKQPPTSGASRLYEAAFGKWRGSTGSFITKGKSTPLRPLAMAEVVLSSVDEIYRHDFLSPRLAVTQPAQAEGEQIVR